MTAHRGARALWIKGTLWLALFPLSLAAAPPSLSVPAKLQAEPGRLCRIVAQTDGKTVKWYSTRTDCDLVPISDSGKIALFVAPGAGVYRVICWTAAGDEPSDAAVCEITVGAGPPPGPPPPPPPVEEITARLQALWPRETDAQRAANATLLADVYQQGHTQFAYDQSLTSAGLLLAALQGAANAKLNRGALPVVRGEVKVYLNTRLSWTSNTPLTDARRQQAAEEFGRVERALRSLK